MLPTDAHLANQASSALHVGTGVHVTAVEGAITSVSKPSAPVVAAKERIPRKGPRRDDPRSLRSRDSLRSALLRLIEHTLFDKITLREITVEAGVSYPTFFNHYDGKDDLFQDIARTEITGLLTAFREDRLSPDWRPGEGICAYLLKRRSLWRTLLTAGASEAMRTEFIRRGRDLASDRASLSHGFPFDVVSAVIISGIFEIISWWLAQGINCPAESVSNMLETLVIEPALDLPRGYFTGRKGLPKHKS
jgi:AcrR family transcriptional regulator